ncbi:MAG: ABC transporter substrate-binding protein, partial [Actinomycetota bacterium]
MTRSLGAAAVAALLALVLAACGGDDETSAATATDSASAAATTTEAAITDDEADAEEAEAEEAEDAPLISVIDETGEQIDIDSIERIIPLDGTVAEVVFALGLGDNVVATDLSATYPDAADALPEIGYQRALSAEPIAAFEPTVLLATEIAGPPEVLDDLRRLGYP